MSSSCCPGLLIFSSPLRCDHLVLAQLWMLTVPWMLGIVEATLRVVLVQHQIDAGIVPDPVFGTRLRRDGSSQVKMAGGL
jgi:hypothetical protein